MFLEILQKSQKNTCARGNTCARFSFLIKLQANFIKKESLAQVFSCKFCKITKSTFLQNTSGRLLLVTFSFRTLKRKLEKYELRKISNKDEMALRVIILRNSRSEVFCKKGVLRNFGKFTGKHLWQSFFFNKVASVSPATLFKKRLWHKCFP